ncbi:MAG TPA: glutaredoxin family protein [Dehalococcoidia bacterium]|nr:glutaredoxin family protein [Dehalococcoidia bacterium]
MTPEVTLYTRRDCGLCHEAADVLRQLSPELRFTLTERDVDADAGLRGRYGDAIPVVAVGGREIARAPFDAAALRAALVAALR